MSWVQVRCGGFCGATGWWECLAPTASVSESCTFVVYLGRIAGGLGASRLTC